MTKRAPRPSIPEGLRAAVARAETIGRALYRDDDAAARGTDVVRAARPVQKLIGWVTQPRGGDRFDVSFVANAPPFDRARYVAHLTATSAEVESIDPPQPLDAEGAAMFRARRLVLGSADAVAAQAGFQRCPLPYNVSTLPASLLGEEGWLVYLLAASPDTRKRVLAGHLRVRVSADGSTILDATALSKSCLVIDAEDVPAGARPAGMFITHLLGPTPNETHVFTSLLYREALFVGTATTGAAWRIEGGRIELLASQ
jgi:hypothetical protein